MHPNKVEGYREAARAIRTIGRDCIQKRIRAIENGEDVPDDILSHILQITGKLNDVILVCQCLNACSLCSCSLQLFLPIVKEENVDIEDLIDDFATFYIAGN